MQTKMNTMPPSCIHVNAAKRNGLESGGNNNLPGFKTKNAGFGLIEIMVGLAVGVISMVVVMQVYSGFEGQKRSATSGSDAQSNSTIALYLMEREIKMGGNGMSEGTPRETPPLAGCPTWLVDKTGAFWRPGLLDSTLTAAGAVTRVRLAPAVVSDGGGGASDTLSIAYGTSSVTAPFEAAADFSGGTGATTLNLLGSVSIRPGDMIALIQGAPTTPAGSNATSAHIFNIPPRDCSLLQATAVAGGTVTLAATSRYNNARPNAGNPTPATGAAGMFEEQDSLINGTGMRVFNLGQLNIVTYRIVNGNLVADTSRFGVIPDGTPAGGAITNSTAATPLASGIVNMQIQYGVDTSNTNWATCAGATSSGGTVTQPTPTATDADSIVDTWTDATGARWVNNNTTSPTAIDLRRIRAVRIGLVARSGVMEKDCATNPVTTAAPVISWETGPAMNPDLTADPNWQCYRYKIYQTTISLRNTAWSSSMNPASDASCRG